MHALGTILRRYWRGECSLALSFWLFTVVGTVLLADGLPLLRRPIEGPVFDPRRIVAYIALGSVLTVGFGFYQAVGLWRSASRTRREHRALGRNCLASWAVQLLIVLAGANLGLHAVRALLPTTREFYDIAFRGDPNVPDVTLRPSADGTRLLVSGGFKYGLAQRFVAQADAMPALRIVQLASVGGRIGEALHLARLIREKGLDTYVSDACYSACTLAFAAGRRRWLGPGATLGYHAESFLGQAIALHGGDNEERTALLAAGLEASFVDEAMATPPQRMWTPSAARLLAAKAITTVGSPDHVVASDAGAPPGRAPHPAE